MRISTRLKVAAAVPLIMAVIALVGFGVTRAALLDLQQQEARAVEISIGLNELNDLARSYVATHEQRPREQFVAKHAEVLALIDDATEHNSAYGAELESMATDVHFVGSLFDRIVANYDASGAAATPAVLEAEQQLSGQLFLRSREANETAADIVVALGQDMVDQQRQSYLTTGVSAFALATVLALALLGLTRSVTRSIEQLSAGTEIVGAGDLEHRIALNLDDELSDLARSFNRMTSRLRTATVSSELLAQEVDRRTRIAHELDAERNQLEAVLGNMSEGVGVWSADGSRIRVNDAMAAMYGLENEAETAQRLGDLEGVTIRNMEGQPLDKEEWPDARVIRGESFSNVLLDVSIQSRDVRFVGSHSGAPVRDPDGSLLFGVLTVHDLTDVLAAQERERQELATTHTLLRVAHAVSTWTEMEPLLQDLARLVLEAVGYERVTVGLLDPEMPEVRVVDRTREHVSVQRAVAISDVPRPVRDVLRSGMTTILDYDALPNSDLQAVPDGARLVVYVPINYGEESIGWIAADTPDERRSSSPREVDILEAVASQVAVAVENARRFQAEHDISERLQTALLELPSDVEGLTFAHLYHSASLSARVGGDFYDLFEMDGGRVGITMGDVAGKGLNAAALTAVVKNTIRAHASDGGRIPAQVLELTNDLLFRSTEPETFVTVWFGILSLRDGSLQYASAGHPPAYILKTNGSAVEAPATAPLLGAMQGVRVEAGRPLTLDRGDSLFLYTDGLTEARWKQEMYGEARLAQVVSQLAVSDQPPEELVRAVMQNVLDFAHDRLMDDVAILALRLVADS